eukprot:1159928-Pelagomonas_calceolata.AAC.5
MAAFMPPIHNHAPLVRMCAVLFQPPLPISKLGPQARCNFALPGEIGYMLPDSAGGAPLPGIKAAASHGGGNHHYGGHGGARKRGSFNHGAHGAGTNAQTTGGFAGQQKLSSPRASSRQQQQLQPGGCASWAVCASCSVWVRVSCAV